MDKGIMMRNMAWREGRITHLGSTERVKHLSRTFMSFAPRSACTEPEPIPRFIKRQRVNQRF